MTDTDGVTVPEATAAPVPPTEPAAPAKPKSKTWLWVALAVSGILLLCCCAGAFLVGGPILTGLGLGAAGTGAAVFDAAQGNAQERSCFANERTVEGAYQQYMANTSATDLLDASVFLDTLVSEGYLKQAPECPGGGSYLWDPESTTLTCSEHGHY